MAGKLKKDPKKYRSSLNKTGGNNEKEKLDPEGAAEIIDTVTDPFIGLKQAAEACNFPTGALQALVKRLETKYQPVGEHVKKMKTNDILRMINEKIYMALDHMDPYTFANAELRDLAVTFSILAEKRQLLMGEPTQILSVQERSHMNELIPNIIREAERRGMTIDVTPINAFDEPGVDARVLPVHETTEREVSMTVRKLPKKPEVDRNLE